MVQPVTSRVGHTLEWNRYIDMSEASLAGYQKSVTEDWNPADSSRSCCSIWSSCAVNVPADDVTAPAPRSNAIWRRTVDCDSPTARAVSPQVAGPCAIRKRRRRLRVRFIKISSAMETTAE